MNLAPIALFVYNRPWHTTQTIEALKKNKLASESDLYIFSDGAKEPQAWKEVEAVRKYIRAVSGFKSVTIEESLANNGLANSIIHGVTKVVNQYGKIIVLEDDILTSPMFLEYMNKSLDIYLNEDKVWHICGYTPPIKIELPIKEHFFIKPAGCWGWATWADCWQYFKRDTDYFISRFNRKLKRDFNINNSYNYYLHLLWNQQNKIRTWAIFWYATVFFNGGLCLHPSKSYVQNIGHDLSGTHCGNSTNYDVIIEEQSLGIFPTQILENKIINKSLQQYYKTLTPSIIKRLATRSLKIIKRVSRKPDGE